MATVTAEPVDWSVTTWEGNRRRQHRAFLALPLAAKLAVSEDLAEVAGLFARRRAARGDAAPKAGRVPMAVRERRLDGEE